MDLVRWRDESEKHKLIFFLFTKAHCFSLFPNRGKGDYFRLGHGTDVHVRKPQMVEGLRGKKIVHVAVGALHCLAVTDTGQVCTDLVDHVLLFVTMVVLLVFVDFHFLILY